MTDGLVAWNDPELQTHPLWWCDYEWDPKTCPHPSIANDWFTNGAWRCDACGATTASPGELDEQREMK